MLEVFTASLARDPAVVAIRYFDGSVTLDDLDRASSALAAVLVARGFRPGDRLALYLQNNPAFVVGLLAAWKAGGAAVAVNPMNKERELLGLLSDLGARALLCLDELYGSVARRGYRGCRVGADGRGDGDHDLETNWPTRCDARVLTTPRDSLRRRLRTGCLTC